MPIDIDQKLKEFDDKLGAMKKDFEIKLSTAENEAKQYKDIAEKNAIALKEFEAKAVKAEEDRKKALFEARKTDIKVFVDQSVKEAKITPAMAEIVTKLMEAATAEGVVHSFEQKDGSKTDHTQFSLMKLFIGMLAPHKAFVSMTPASGAQKRAVPSAESEKQYTEIKRGGETVTAELDEFETDAAAKQYIADAAKIGKSVSYEEALIEISRAEKAQLAQR